MHTLSKRLQYEEVKDDELMRDDRGANKKNKLGDDKAMAITNQYQQMIQSNAKLK